jgi:hypothetical protein
MALVRSSREPTVQTPAIPARQTNVPSKPPSKTSNARDRLNNIDDTAQILENAFVSQRKFMWE